MEITNFVIRFFFQAGIYNLKFYNDILANDAPLKKISNHEQFETYGTKMIMNNIINIYQPNYLLYS